MKKKLRFLITGGAGFVGSHLCEKINSKFKDCSIIILDKITYAGDKSNLKNVLKNKNNK